MNLQEIGSDLFKLSPLIGLLALTVYVLWTNLQKVQTALLDTMKAHADDRKVSQDKMSSVVTENSVTNLRLAGSVDNLSKSVTDTKTETNVRLLALESKVERSARQRNPVKTT